MSLSRQRRSRGSRCGVYDILTIFKGVVCMVYFGWMNDLIYFFNFSCGKLYTSLNNIKWMMRHATTISHGIEIFFQCHRDRDIFWMPSWPTNVRYFNFPLTDLVKWLPSMPSWPTNVTRRITIDISAMSLEVYHVTCFNGHSK